MREAVGPGVSIRADANQGYSVKEAILKRLGARIKEMTQVSMALEEVPYGTLPRFEYKVRRWTDERIEGLERIKYIEKK